MSLNTAEGVKGLVRGWTHPALPGHPPARARSRAAPTPLGSRCSRLPCRPGCYQRALRVSSRTKALRLSRGHPDRSPLPATCGPNLSDSRVAQNRYGAATEVGSARFSQRGGHRHARLPASLSSASIRCSAQPCNQTGSEPTRPAPPRTRGERCPQGATPPRRGEPGAWAPVGRGRAHRLP